MTKTFSEQFKEARTATELSVAKLAERILISKRTLEKWESGERTPPLYIQRFVLDEIERIKHEKDVELLIDYLRETGQDEKLRAVTGMDTAPSIILELYRQHYHGKD